MTTHIASVRTNWIVFVTLLVLLFGTVGAAYLPLGPLHFPTAMAIAAAKAVLIVLFFMHVLYGSKLIRVVSVAGFVWLLILIVFTLADYLSRGWLNIPGK
jgi:cytochrome c oxidase subunit IV